MLMKEMEEDTNRWIEEDTNHVLGLEGAILLKWPYYPSQSIDSRQSLSNYQWHFSQNWNKKKFFLIYIGTQKTLSSQNNLEKEWNWRNHTPWPQTILRNDSNQKSVVLAQKQKYRSMEQAQKWTHTLIVN